MREKRQVFIKILTKAVILLEGQLCKRKESDNRV